MVLPVALVARAISKPVDAIALPFAILPSPIVLAVVRTGQDTVAVELIVSPTALVHFLLRRTAATFPHDCAALAVALTFHPVSPVRAAAWGHKLTVAFA
jgi:hypothetical protein